MVTKTMTMKKLTTIILFSCVMFATESFTGNIPKTSPAYSFTVDRAPFEAMTVNNYYAVLDYNSPTAKLTFNGKAVVSKDGKELPTKLEIDYTLRGDALGEVNVTRVAYEYNNQKYNLQAGTAFMSITKMKWSADRKNFTLCADIFCKVRPNYIMEEFVPVLVIRGNVQNITVNLPVS